MLTRRAVLPLSLSLALPRIAAAAPARPVVVELFTSQGCSSCPPADALLRELAPDPGVLALAWHVTYWNNLGWRDPFSLDAATARQKEYGRLVGDGTIYTPQMVIDGRADAIGSDRLAVSRALRDAAARGGEAVPVALRRQGDTVAVSLGAGDGEAKVLLLGFDPSHRTQVGRGENAGRALVEANIVRAAIPLGWWHGAARDYSAPVPEGGRLAVLVQSTDGTVRGAAQEAVQEAVQSGRS